MVACESITGVRPRSPAAAQAKGWCQAMCLNVGRTRRRLRKTLTDSWRLLAQHAANADASPEFQLHLRAAGWRWRQHDSEGYSLQVHTCILADKGPSLFANGCAYRVM